LALLFSLLLKQVPQLSNHPTATTTGFLILRGGSPGGWKEQRAKFLN
jgi:hypothetical protein